MDMKMLKEQFVVDHATGRLKRCGRNVGYLTTAGYVAVRFGCQRLMAHRVVWALVTGEWPHLDIDHINGVRTDNRPINLRHVTRAVNCQNKGGALATNGTTGLLGVNYHASNGKRFRAQIWLDGKNRHIGYFATPAEAHAAYIDAKAKLHEGFVPERFA